MLWTVYTLANPRSKEVRYVGWTTTTIEERLRRHVNESLRGQQTHKDRWILALVSIGLMPVAEIVESGSGDRWAEAERAWIARYRSAGARLVNSTLGGEGVPVHGMKRTTEYTRWCRMKASCSNPRSPGWKRNGGIGIAVHPDFWTFQGFFAYIGKCPPGMRLDRMDISKDYAPGNVRWAVPAVQMRGRDDSRQLTYNGETKTLTNWAQAMGVSTNTLWSRLTRNNWDLTRSLSTPLLNASQISKLGHQARWHLANS